MTSEPKLVEDRINTWVQIAGILIAAVWGIYTFIYKEIRVPSAVPVNTTLGLEIRSPDAKSAVRRDGMVPLSVIVSAANPSTRSVEFFNSIFVVQGYRNKKKERYEFDERLAREALNSDGLMVESRFSDKPEIDFIAAGRLFEDSGLKPGEKITRTELLYIPADMFDAVELSVYVPTATSTEGLEQIWEIKGLGVASMIKVAATHKDADVAVLKSHEYAESEARVKISL
jgi:hypothetical protein